MFDEGMKDEMLGKIQIKLDKTNDHLHKIMTAL